MKNLKDIKKIYFLGIGGIGMSALARYFKSLGAEVSGYDKTQTVLTDELEREGIHVIFEDDVNLYPKEIDLVVYTPAIPKDHKGFNFYKDNNYELSKRSEVLGIISADRFTIAVAGSHGKTTVSSMIAHILTQSGFGCSAFLGGIVVGLIRRRNRAGRRDGNRGFFLLFLVVSPFQGFLKISNAFSQPLRELRESLWSKHQQGRGPDHQ